MVVIAKCILEGMNDGRKYLCKPTFVALNHGYGLGRLAHVPTLTGGGADGDGDGGRHGDGEEEGKGGGRAPWVPGFAPLLLRCGTERSLPEGKCLHARLVGLGSRRDGRFLGNLLIRMYGNCGRVADARSVFDRICTPNVYSWNLVVAAYAHVGCLEDARLLFNRMPKKDVVSWTTMISALSHYGHGSEALDLFQEMRFVRVKPDKIALLGVLDACSELADALMGRMIHASIVDNKPGIGAVLGSAIVHMYAKCGDIVYARRVFEKTPKRDILSWNSMIAGYARNRLVEDARDLFNQMPERNLISWNTMIAVYAQIGEDMMALELFHQASIEGAEPDDITFVGVLDACSSATTGKLIHACIIKRGDQVDLIVANALVDFYGKLSSGINNASRVFRRMSQWNAVSWTTMIAAFARNGHRKGAVELSEEMSARGVKPDKIFFITALGSFADLAALKPGKAVHARFIDSGIEPDVPWDNAVIALYSKCGSLGDASSAFHRMVRCDVVSWNTMMAAYAQNGHGKRALEMLLETGLDHAKDSDDVTFTIALSMCSHEGLLNDAWGHFVSMHGEHGIASRLEHYRCMVDLLGRSGQLKEAEDLINNMPCEQDATSWLNLLSAFRIHSDVPKGVSESNRREHCHKG